MPSGLTAEDRLATDEEAATLLRYVGWGGIPQAFDAKNANWQSEFQKLREVLSEEEYKTARRSTLNAHYTSLPVVRAIWQGLSRMGVQRGRMLEPSAGVGHFIGGRPQNVSGQWHAVELDQITGSILKAIYPKANVHVTGFEKVGAKQGLREDSFDLVISNVPFGDYQVADFSPQYKGLRIHNYFIARSVDMTRPGGITAIITSHHSLDAKDPTFRQRLQQKARLLGAVRLPRQAFRENAGTEVVTDILFLQRRPEGEVPAADEPQWAEVVMGGPDGNIPMNEYFRDWSENMLGEPSLAGTMYGGREEFTLDNQGDWLAQLQRVMAFMPKDVVATVSEPTESLEELVLGEPETEGQQVRQTHQVVHQDGGFYIVDDQGELSPHPDQGKQSARRRMTQMIGLRDQVVGLLSAEAKGEETDAQLGARRHKLNRTYDHFTKTFKRTRGKKKIGGALHDGTNARLMEMDPDFPKLLSIEEYDTATGEATKGGIFTQRQLFPPEALPPVTSPQEALFRSFAERGMVDVSYMAEQLSQNEHAVVEPLWREGHIFFDPNKKEWQTAAKYLSGDLGSKIDALESPEIASQLTDQERAWIAPNLEALRQALPEPLEAEQIGVRLGSGWLPADTIGDFARELLNAHDVLVEHTPLGNWDIRFIGPDHVQNRNNWGIEDLPATKIIERMLNNKNLNVYYPAAKGERRVLNTEATAQATGKAQQITERFAAWIWEDASRTEELVARYNRQLRRQREPNHNGEHLPFTGMAADRSLRPKQKNAVWRIIEDGRLLLGHAVGAGKTAVMVAAAMEMRRLGIARKPVIAVNKANLRQWSEEIYKWYPQAKLLAATENSLDRRSRRRFVGRMVSGDWDIVLITHEQLRRLPLSEGRLDMAMNMFEGQWHEILNAMDAEGDSKSVKDTEKAIEQQKVKIAKLLGQAAEWEKFDLPHFEDLGVDFLMVDEAHFYKNLFFPTSMGDIKGVGGNRGSDKAMDLYLKIIQLREQNDGRGLVLATGTPVTNTMSEVYTMQRYMQDDVLRAHGVATFDAWASTFGEVVSPQRGNSIGQGL